LPAAATANTSLADVAAGTVIVRVNVWNGLLLATVNDSLNRSPRLTTTVPAAPRWDPASRNDRVYVPAGRSNARADSIRVGLLMLPSRSTYPPFPGR
jgi:hypothetical protein